jgi:hypothetical protein
MAAEIEKAIRDRLLPKEEDAKKGNVVEMTADLSATSKE